MFSFLKVNEMNSLRRDLCEFVQSCSESSLTTESMLQEFVSKSEETWLSFHW